MLGCCPAWFAMFCHLNVKISSNAPFQLKFRQPQLNSITKQISRKVLKKKNSRKTLELSKRDDFYAREAFF